MNLTKFRLERRHGKTSFSQSGEDLIALFVLDALGVKTPSYADIGAFHPVELSNTYLFYRRGSVGVCIEPEVELYSLHRKYRPYDICLNVGVGPKAGSSTFYKMSTPSLSTFSNSEAARYASFGSRHVVSSQPITLIDINTVFETYCHGAPDFVSMDTEGFELQILQSLDFNRFRPKVWCIETLTYDEGKQERKLRDVINYVTDFEYFIYADTYINTIFVDKRAWLER